MSRPGREERVAPNIYRTPHGWRVYIRRDGALKAFRFKPTATLEELQDFVDGFRDEATKLRAARREAAATRAGTFAGDAARYLTLKTVGAMPSYVDRAREIARWVVAFGKRPRHTISARDIDEQLQAWRNAGDAPASVNKYRTALMSLYTRLDGRAAANPVRETRVFEEPPAQPRGLPYDLVKDLLDAMPLEQSRPVKGEKGSRSRGSLTRARFEIMAWTGMTPMQIQQLRPEHINLKARWYISPPRRKGSRRSRHPRPAVRKWMTRDAAQAFKRFVALKAWGTFSTRSLRHTLERARRKVEQALRKKRRDKSFVLARIRPYDFRHSFGTELYRRTQNEALVAEMLDHSSLQMTKRYTIGAREDVLRAGMRQFEAATTRAQNK